MPKEVTLRGPILVESAGPSVLSVNPLGWDIEKSGSEAGPTCELCGKKWPEGTDVTVWHFFNLVVVEDCCGGLIDALYQLLGTAFTLQFLKDFQNHPFDPRFKEIGRIMVDSNLVAVLTRSQVKSEHETR